MRLTRQQLEADTGVAPSELDDLIALGAVRPDAEGMYEWADAHRIRMVRSFMSAGVQLSHLQRALRERLLDFGPVAGFFLPPSPRTGRTFFEFADALGDQAHLVPRIYESLGVVIPPPHKLMTSDEEELIGGLVEAWSSIGDERSVDRAARLAGDGVRRTVEGWMALWVELMGPEGTGPGEVDQDRSAEVGLRLTSLLPRLLVWLEQRQLEQTFNAVNADLFEAELARRGWIPPPEPDPPAVAFVDVSGFTQLTEEHGDRMAVEVGERLYRTTTDVARRRGGRLIKLLGDGAMLAFPNASSALAGALEIVGSSGTLEAGLPATRAGVEAGKLIEQDGDIFGRTVNLAARLCGLAGPAEVVVGEGVVSNVGTGDAWHFDPVGPVDLKGFAQPVAAYRVTAADSGS